METLTNTLEKINKGRWQWQSNTDPWSKTEEPKFESYPLDHNYLIEKTYYDGQKEVDLGDYLVYPFDLLQRKKGNPQAQRPIRRIDWTEDEEMNDRSARYFESELPKTINRIFGGLGDFVSFFSRRNKEILDFTRHFKELEKLNDLDILNNKITPKLVECLKGVLLDPNEQQLNDPSLSEFKKKMLLKVRGKLEELISSFKKQFSSFEEFYGQILKAYTMNTDLYPGLNKYLRNESWMEIDKLLPYAFCLCKAFFNLNLRKLNPERQDPSEEIPSIILYRGTAFDEFARSFYDTAKIQYFSWNSVTSATTNEKLAEEFMYNSVDTKKKKDPVMFVIEIPDLTESGEYLKWLDIRQYSAIPKEDEVVLPPGSVFELVEVFTDKDEKTTIKIKLMNEVQTLARRGLMMQGTLQSQMMTEREAKIMCLEGEELSQALMSLDGNKLIEEVEFCLCLFDEKNLKKMLQILPKIENAKTLKFISCIYEGKREFDLEKFESSGITKIEVVEANDFFQTICNESLNQVYWASLRDLCLDFQSRRNLQDEEVNSLVSQGLKYLTQLTSLKITFEECKEITDKAVGILAKGLNPLTQLTSLGISFAEAEQITDKGVSILASQGLKRLTELTSLALNFDCCNEVTDKSIKILASQVFKSLPGLRSLNLGFGGCRQMTDEGLECLGSKGIKFLNQLESLSLDFTGCAPITDNGMMSLASKGLKNLTQLTSLNLDFEWCPGITDKGLKSLALNCLKFFVKLTDLSLNFRSCLEITDLGLQSLSSSLQENCLQLKSLALYFGECNNLTDEGLESLVSCTLKELVLLTFLNLNFFECNKITDKSVENLACQGIKNLNRLKSLTLSFFACRQITYEAVKVLMSQGLQDLAQLTSLDLNFMSCNGITDEEVQTLALQSLKNLVPLEYLKINYKLLQAASINDTQKEFLSNLRIRFIRKKSQLPLCDKGVLPLTSESCGEPVSSESSDESEEDLTEEFCGIIAFVIEDNDDDVDLPLKIPETLCKFQHLTSLTLDFRDCQGTRVDDFYGSPCYKYEEIHRGEVRTIRLFHTNKIRKITDAEVEILTQVLKSLTRLTSLTMDFSWCHQITDKGLVSLSQNGLKYLSQLTFFSLHFYNCNEITDEGVGGLASQGLKFLINLKSLTLGFNDCRKISDKGLIYLSWHGLRYLCQLKSLALGFVDFDQITNEGVSDLAWYGLKHLCQLESLSLGFTCCEITDEGLGSLATQGLKYLSQLKTLKLNFYGCWEITDEGLINLTWYGLGHLSQLESLALSFYECDQITDEGIDGFISKGLRNMSKLRSLKLDFSLSQKVTDKGMNNLILRGLKSLPQLTFLDLDLAECINISDFTIRNITKVLHYFGFKNYTGEEEDFSDEAASESE